MIQAKSERGLSAKRVYQDLVGDLGARVSYDGVQRRGPRIADRLPEGRWVRGRLSCQIAPPGEDRAARLMGVMQRRASQQIHAGAAVMRAYDVLELSRGAR